MTDASVVVLRGVVPDVTGRNGSGDGGIGEPELEISVRGMRERERERREEEREQYEPFHGAALIKKSSYRFSVWLLLPWLYPAAGK